jgi:dienelactone hydrolase
MIITGAKQEVGHQTAHVDWAGIAGRVGPRGARAEKLTLHSATYANFGKLLLGRPTRPVAVSANLQFPARTADRYPAVVVAHTIGGYNPKNEGWFAAKLRAAGYATLTYDSFAARGLGRVVKGGNPSLSPSALADAYAGLKSLAAQPKVAPARIAVIGFSLGGDTAHLAALTAVRNALAPQRKFAAHVGFYPAWVDGTVAGRGAYTGAPVLLLFGSKDEVNPQPKVHAYLAYFARAHTGAPIETKVYPSAHHAWTNPRFRRPRFHADLGSARRCPMILIRAGFPRQLIDGKARKFDRALWRTCQRKSRGYTMGYSEAVRAHSLADMLAFLDKHIGH